MGRLTIVPFTPAAWRQESHSGTRGGAECQKHCHAHPTVTCPIRAALDRTSTLYCVAYCSPASVHRVHAAQVGVLYGSVQSNWGMGQLVELLCKQALSRIATQPPAGVVAGCLITSRALVWSVAITVRVGALHARQG